MAEQKNRKLFCRKCKGNTNQKELQSVESRGDYADGYVQWIHNFAIFECLGCETISFFEIYGDTEMTDYGPDGEEVYYFNETIYPNYLDEGNEIQDLHLVPGKISSIYKETINALKTKSYILAAGGLRAVIEAVCNHLRIKKGNLAERIDLLHKKGHLTLGESKRLHSIRFLGNDALHEMEIPKKDPLIILLEIVNHLLSNLFINDQKIKGKVDVIIDTYEEFLKLIQNKISKDMIGHEYTLVQFLGKLTRLFPKDQITIFEKQFIIEVNESKHNYISITENEPVTKFKIKKEPDLSFGW